MTTDQAFPEWEKPLSEIHSLAAESEQGLSEETNFPARLTRYHKARLRSLRMADYSGSMGDVKSQNALKRCGAFLLFRQYYTVGKIRLHAAQFCKKHLLCPLCAIRRAAKHVRLYHARVMAALQANPRLRAYFVTLTVKDGADLSERFRHLTAAVRDYQQQRRNYLKGRGPHVEMAKAAGVVGSYEFKRGSGSGLWHPHVHMVWLCESEPDAAKLSKEWHALTGDSFIVDSQPLTGDGIDGFLEVFKYALKMSDLPLHDNWEAFQLLQRKRLVFSLGNLYGVETPDDLTDDKIALDDLPYLERLYRHTPTGYQLDLEGSQLDPDAKPFDPLEGMFDSPDARVAFVAWNRQRLIDAEQAERDELHRLALDAIDRLTHEEFASRPEMPAVDRWHLAAESAGHSSPDATSGPPRPVQKAESRFEPEAAADGGG